MLKSLLDSIDDLPAELHEHYAQRADGRYALQTDSLHELRSAFEKEKRRRIQAERKAGMNPDLEPQETQSPRDKFFVQAEERLRGLDGDARTTELAKIEAELDVVIADEVASIRSSHEATTKKQEATIARIHRENAAINLLRDIAKPGCFDLLKPHVLNRLTSDIDGNVSVLDTDGKPMSISLDELKSEFRDSPAMNGLVRGADQSEQAAHARMVAAVIGSEAIN